MLCARIRGRESSQPKLKNENDTVPQYDETVSHPHTFYGLASVTLRPSESRILTDRLVLLTEVGSPVESKEELILRRGSTPASAAIALRGDAEPLSG